MQWTSVPLLQVEIAAQATDHHVVMLFHFRVAPFLPVAGDLRHLPQLGALFLDRVPEVQGLGAGQAVAELRVGAYAHERQVTQPMEPVFGDLCARLLLVRMLRIEMFDRIPEGEPEVRILPVPPEQIVEIGKDNPVDVETTGFFAREESFPDFSAGVVAQGGSKLGLRQLGGFALLQKLQQPAYPVHRPRRSVGHA